MSFIFNLHLNILKSKESNQAVIFDGGGGDEAFFGHEHHLISYLSQLLKNKRYSKFFKEINFYKGYNSKSLRYFLYRSIYHCFPIDIKNRYKKFISNSRNLIEKDSIYIDFENYFNPEQIYNSFFNTINNWVMPNVTSINDKIAGYYGTVLRTPFTDYRLYEFALKIKYEDHFNQGTKSLLRHNSAVNLSDDIRYRKSKSQFPGGLEIFCKQNISMIRDYCLDSLNDVSFIDKNKFEPYFSKLVLNKSYDSIFRYYIFFMWNKNLNFYLN